MTDDVNKPNRDAIGLRRAIGDGIVGAGAVAIGLVNPILGIVAGAAAPLISAQLSNMLTSRATLLKLELDRAQIDLDELNAQGRTFTNAQLELLRDAISSALGTDYDIKVAMIVRVLKAGLAADVDAEVFAAKRLARTVSRLEELEFLLMSALYNPGSGPGSLALSDIVVASRVPNRDVVRSSLAVLYGEGLIKLEPGPVDRWQLSEYGYRLGSNLRELYDKK